VVFFSVLIWLSLREWQADSIEPCLVFLSQQAARSRADAPAFQPRTNHRMQEAPILYPVMLWQGLSRLEKDDAASILGEGVISGRVTDEDGSRLLPGLLQCACSFLADCVFQFAALLPDGLTVLSRRSQ
jgi:hypothetical protein